MELHQLLSCRQIASQLFDSGTSVGANSAESQSAYSRREFALKNCIFLKESRESAFWLRVILACELTADPEAARLLASALALPVWLLLLPSYFCLLPSGRIPTAAASAGD